MDTLDPQMVRLWAQGLIAPMVLLIALIALRVYVKVRSISSLILSVSFFLLACPSLLAVLELLGLFHWPAVNQSGVEYITQTIQILDALAVGRSVAS